MPDDNRVYDGFTTLLGGMNQGLDPEDIGKDQVAFAKDITFRLGRARTRPPFANIVFQFATASAQTNFSGKFQGAAMYISPFGIIGFVISVSGRLFLFTFGAPNLITEITPNVNMTTANGGNPLTPGISFVVPTLDAIVQIPLNTSSGLAIGQSVVIDGGTYQIKVVLADAITAKYVGGAAHTSVQSGVTVQDSGLNIIVVYEINPPTYDMVFLFQAENYMIALAQRQATVYFDGSTAYLMGANQIPSGVFGAYVNGRIWVVKDNQTDFVGGDLVRSSSGSANLGFVDAILNMTQNTLLNGGGVFSVPSAAGLITGMADLSTLDTSMGLGQLVVGTTQRILTVNAPTDETTWQNLTYPIVTNSVLEYGPKGPRNMVPADSDLWYRATDGIRSFLAAREDFQAWLNTAMSQEVRDILSKDDQSLLIYGSAMLFDNRLYFTCAPGRDTNTAAITHEGMVVINFDQSSTMRNKAPQAWEGLTTGLNVLQLLKGEFNDKERGFAFVSGAGGAIELWEFQTTGVYDQFLNGSNALTNSAIQPVLETRAMSCGDDSMLKKLYTLELFIDEVVETISITVKFRPDQYPVWTTWQTVEVCAPKSQCNLQAPQPFQCQLFQNNASGYAARIMLPMPPETPNPMTDKPINLFYLMQLRFEGVGHFRIRKIKMHAKVQSEPSTGMCPGAVVCKPIPYCATDNFTYDAHGT